MQLVFFNYYTIKMDIVPIDQYYFDIFNACVNYFLLWQEAS